MPREINGKAGWFDESRTDSGATIIVPGGLEAAAKRLEEKPWQYRMYKYVETEVLVPLVHFAESCSTDGSVWGGVPNQEFIRKNKKIYWYDSNSITPVITTLNISPQCPRTPRLQVKGERNLPHATPLRPCL